MKLDITKTVLNSVYWKKLAQDRGRRLVLVNTIKNIYFPKKNAEHFLTS
jgi:hypothetical protein